MGQTYTVEAKLKFKDKENFCNTIKSEIEKRDGKSANFNLEKKNLNLDDPFDCFRALTTVNDSGTYGDVWYAYFSGSYGWESVMVEIFQKAAKYLKDGSVITIYPDSGFDKIAVSNGNVLTSYEDEYEDEDENEE